MDRTKRKDISNIIWINRIILVCWIILGSGLFYLQGIRHDYYLRLSQRNFIRTIRIPAPRGDILDRKLRPLARSELSFDVVINPRTPNKKKAFQLLAKILHKKTKEIERSYKINYSGPYQPVVVAQDIPKTIAFKIEELKMVYPQVGIQPSPKRIYSYGPMLAHIIGYVRPISRKEYARLRPYGYKSRDKIGAEGVEKSYEAYLRGKDGWIKVAVDKLGRPIEILEKKDPVKGESLVLTIDKDIQEIVYNKLKGKVGCVIIMDPYTGEILALANWPSYDNNIFISPNSKEIAELFSNPMAPLLNRAISGIYPPGSTFKLVVAIAGLDSGVITPNTYFYCPGYMEIGKVRFRCAHIHHNENLIDAIAHSCNVYFYHTGLLLGGERLFLYGKRFGFGEKTGIDLPGEHKGLLPSKEWKKKRFSQAWFDGDTLNLSIGQGYLLASPIQVLRMLSAIVNSGKLMRPFIGLFSGTVRLNEPQFRDLMIGEEILRWVRKGMEEVISSPEGTAHVLSDLKFISVAGKTGTAQSQPGKPAHGWFVGYFPCDKPRYTAVVFLEYGKSSFFAAKLLREILIEMHKKGIV